MSPSSSSQQLNQDTVLEARFYKKPPKKTAVKEKKVQQIIQKQTSTLVKKESPKEKTEVSPKSKSPSSQNTQAKSFMADFSSRRSDNKIPKELQKFFKSLSEEINRHKHYPLLSKRLNESGTVVVSFEVYSGGKVENINIKKLCDFDRLNKSAYKVVANISNLAPLPEEYDKVRVTFPLSYVL